MPEEPIVSVRRAHSRGTGLLSTLREPASLVAVGLVLAVAAFHLWLSPSNPPGFYRDEVSLAYNAFTISQNLRDEHGGLLPLYIVSFRDYKSPLFVYALAAVFRVTGPHAEVARGLAASFVLTAILLLGVIARRRTGSNAVALVTVVLAGTTPWLFEVGRIAVEVTLEPLILCVLLLVLERTARLQDWRALRAIPVGLLLGALVYVYAAGRLLGPLLAVALLVFGGRGRWRWLLTAWVSFAATLFPLAVYWQNHPGALSARYRATTFIEDGMSAATIVRSAVGNYVTDLNLWHWLTSGDPKPYVHTWGAGSLLAPLVVLALVGIVVVLVRHGHDVWWRYVLAMLLIAPVPAALTESRFYELRLVPIPLLLTVVAIPAVEVLLRRVRSGWAWRAAAALLVIAGAAQFIHFLDVYRTRGPARTELFEKDVPVLLDRAFSGGATVYVDYDDRAPQVHALWYAAERGMSRKRLVILPDGGVPPAGSVVFGRTQSCDYACTEFARSDLYWLARAD